MKVELENVKPMEIEKRSFEIITEELGDKQLLPGTELIVKRCIHTSADFDYADNLCFSPDVVERAMKAIKEGACIVTDTQMAKAGINKRALARYGGEVYCFMSDEDVAKIAKENGTTRATASMDKAATLDKKLIDPWIFPSGMRKSCNWCVYFLIDRKSGNCGSTDICYSVCFLYDEWNFLFLLRRSTFYLCYIWTSDSGSSDHNLYNDRSTTPNINILAVQI